MELSTSVQVITYTQHTRRTHNMSNLCIARPTQFIFAKLSSAAAMAGESYEGYYEKSLRPSSSRQS